MNTTTHTATSATSCSCGKVFAIVSDTALHLSAETGTPITAWGVLDMIESDAMGQAFDEHVADRTDNYPSEEPYARRTARPRSRYSRR